MFRRAPNLGFYISVITLTFLLKEFLVIYVLLLLLMFLGMMLPLVCCASNGEGDVMKKILKDYSVDERPVKTANMAAKIEFGFKLNSFLDLVSFNYHSCLWS